MKTIKCLTVIALCSVIIYGCSTQSAAPPHLVAVPKNATMVLSLNAKQIIEKAALNKPEQYQCYSLLKREIENEPVEKAKIVKDFLKNTRTSGLNLDRIFAYAVLGDNPSKDVDPCFGIVFLIDDVKTFEDFLKKSGLYPDIKNRIVSFLFVYEGMTIQWNDKIAVLSSGSDANSVDIFNEDETKSVLANELFHSEYAETDDAGLFVEYHSFIPNLLANFPFYTTAAGMPNLIAALDFYKGLSLSLKLNAEKGEFVATGKLLPAEKAGELFGKFYRTDFDNDLYSYFPDKSLIAYKFAMKPLDTYNEYKKYFLDMAVDNYKVEKFMEEHDAKITATLGNFTGDFLGSLSSISLNSMPPDFAVVAGITQGKENAVIALMEELGFVKNPEGYYTPNKRNSEIYFAVNNKAAYLTGTKTNIKNFLDNSHYVSNITATDFGDEFKNASFYFYWDLNLNNYPPILKSLIAMSPTGSGIMPALEKLKSINVQNINLNGSEFKIKFNSDDYASKILLKGLDEWAAQFLAE
jgi:hypothetical protein